MASQYYFDELNPTSFQRLINALLVHRYGEGIRLLPLRGKDGGRDAETPINSSFFEVIVQPPSDGRISSTVKAGRYLFQVKHHRMSDHQPTTIRALVVQDFGKELLNNVLSRSGDDHVDFFFLITNVPSSREIIQKVDEKRLELLGNRKDLHAEVLWQDHITAWLDQTASVWNAFPEIFAGKIVPMLGQIAGRTPSGLPMAIKVALKAQFVRDSIIRFRQVNLEQGLPRLFVDLDAHYSADNTDSIFSDPFSFQIDLHTRILASSPSTMTPRPGVLHYLLVENNRKRSKMILEGGPGQGKSTVTQMLAQIYRSLLVDSSARDYTSYSVMVPVSRLPIRIELRLFAEWLSGIDGSVEQYVAEIFSKDSGGMTVTVDDINLIAQKQPLVVIFDGLDEVGSDELRDRVVSKIVECISRFETTPDTELQVIITSRPPAVAGRLDSLSGFKRVQLLPLSDDRVNTYVERWTSVLCTDGPDRERVVTSFSKRKNEDHVGALAKNPMQLSVLLHFIRLKGEAFPDKRAELYREYFKTVIDRDVEKSPELRLHRDDIETLHEVIGFAIQSRAEGDKAVARLSRPALMELVRGWLISEDRRADLGEKLFKIGEERLGLIVALSGEGASTEYGFEIQPVREYFAAAFINDKCEANAHDLFELMIRRSFWKEVARFLAGLRRANERADLLSRAKQLDEDSNNGWRSDGLTIIHQLLQEGVFTAPGNVHREALSFLISSLNPGKTKARLEPKDLVATLPRLICGCDSAQPRRELKTILENSRKLVDRRDLHRLWSVCLQVLSQDDLLDEMKEYAGTSELEAMIKLLWPAEVGLSFANRLDKAGELYSIPADQLARQWFSAGCLDENVRNLASTTRYHWRLFEEFAFNGILDKNPTDWCKSPFAVWQLGGYLHNIGVTLNADRGKIGETNPNTDFSGLPVAFANSLQEVLALAKDASDAEVPARKKAINRLLVKLTDMVSGDGLMSIVASRCATTLLGYSHGYPRSIHMPWFYTMRNRQISPVVRGKAWHDLKLALMPLFRSAIPEVRDRLGRISTAPLMNRSFFLRMQSHIYAEGQLVPVMSLLERADSQEHADLPDWLARVPIQQYWLSDFLTEQNVQSVLLAVNRHTLEWRGPLLPLTSTQAGYIASVVKQNENLKVSPNALFALKGSKMWVHVRESLLSKLLRCDSVSSGRAESIFEMSEYSPAPPPVALMSVATRFVTGELKGSSSISFAAANFLSGRKGVSLPPLRESKAFPKWKGFAGPS